MSYYNILQKSKGVSLEKFFNDISAEDINKAISSDNQDENRLLILLSPNAESYLEDLAQKAHSITLQHFGKTIQIYTPLYLSNYCDNQCVYCGFNSKNNLERKRLGMDEVKKEAEYIASTGLQHVLVLTGDSKSMSPLKYIKDCINILKKHFSSISVEIYPLTESEYGELADLGVDGLTLYQETYDEEVYAGMHGSGPKKDYLFRLNGPERAAKSGIRNVNIGVLLGLNEWRRDIFLTGLHAKYLQEKYPDLEVGVSIPRLRPHMGSYRISNAVSDKNIVQIITALRIFMPRLSINLSTRENPVLRENLIPLGVTRMSAGSSTIVGGHTIAVNDEENTGQFEISDKRSIGEMKAALSSKGYQPVLKNWMRI